MRSSSARADSAIPTRPYAAAAPPDQSASDDPAHVDRAGDRALAAVLATPAEQDQAGAGPRADGDRRDRAPPVARVAHRAQLPALELVDGELGEVPQRRLEPLREVLGRVDRRERAPDHSLEVVARCLVAHLNASLPGVRSRSPRAA